MIYEKKGFVLFVFCYIIAFLLFIENLLLNGFNAGLYSLSNLAGIAFYVVIGLGILKNDRKLINCFLLGYLIFLFLYPIIMVILGGFYFSAILGNIGTIIRILLLFLTSYFNIKKNYKISQTTFIIFSILTGLSALLFPFFNIIKFGFWRYSLLLTFIEFLTPFILILQIFICYWLRGDIKIEKTEQVDGYVGIAGHVLLLIFTFGIWNLIWIYNTTTYLNKNNRDSLSKLLLCMFVPFYFIYWVNQYSNKIDNDAQKKNIYSNISGIATVLAIFTGIGAQIIMQCKINELTQNKKTSYSSESISETRFGVADEIKKYKELYDMGAITLEEYENKKKQLLRM